MDMWCIRGKWNKKLNKNKKKKKKIQEEERLQKYKTKN